MKIEFELVADIIGWHRLLVHDDSRIDKKPRGEYR